MMLPRYLHLKATQEINSVGHLSEELPPVSLMKCHSSAYQISHHMEVQYLNKEHQCQDPVVLLLTSIGAAQPGHLVMDQQFSVARLIFIHPEDHVLKEFREIQQMLMSKCFPMDHQTSIRLGFHLTKDATKDKQIILEKHMIHPKAHQP